jgi:hypothetical protein
MLKPHRVPRESMDHTADRPWLPGVLAWSAWRRVAVVLPALCLLWLAVWWAGVEALPL